jgi:hypothetical protein
VDQRRRSGGYWYCLVRRREADQARYANMSDDQHKRAVTRERERYHNLTGTQYNRRLLQMRRQLALRRQRSRHEAVA